MTSRAPVESYIEQLLADYPQHRGRFTLEPGSKHYKLRLDGRVILVVPRTARSVGCQARNAAAAVRRALRA